MTKSLLALALSCALAPAIAEAAPNAASGTGVLPQSTAKQPCPPKRRGKKKQRKGMTNAKGTIVMVSDGVFAIVPDSDPGTRYISNDLPEEFKQNGLKVVFSGDPQPIPPNVRLMGTPLTLCEIHRQDAP